MQGLAVLLGFVQTDFHLAGLQVGLLFAMANLAPVFTLPYVGSLLDHRSERHIIAGGCLLMALALLGASYAPTYLVLMGSLFVVGIGYSTIQPGGSRSVSSWFQGRELGMAMGLRQAALPVGGALAAATLPWLVHWGNRQGAFLACLCMVLVGGGVFFMVYRSPTDHYASTRTSKQAFSLSAMLSCLRQPWMRRITLFGLVMVAVQNAIVVYLMLFLRDVHQIALVHGAQILFVAQLCGGLGRVVLASLGDILATRKDRFFPVYLSFAAIMAGLVMLLLLPNQVPIWVLMVLAAWLGFFGFGWYGPWVTYIAHAAPRESLGLALGTAMGMNQIAILLVPPLLGALYDMTGHYVMVWLSLLCAQVGVFLFFQVKWRHAG